MDLRFCQCPGRNKDYGSWIPIQISIYEDQVYIWNDSQLPDAWTMQELLDKHPSLPYNPEIANAFFRAGYIESWGRGLVKIRTACTNVGLPEPTFNFKCNGLMVHFKGGQVAASEKMSGERRENVGKTSEKTADVSEKMEKKSEKITDVSGKTSEKILELIKADPEITIRELATIVGISDR